MHETWLGSSDFFFIFKNISIYWNYASFVKLFLILYYIVKVFKQGIDCPIKLQEMQKNKERVEKMRN